MAVRDITPAGMRVESQIGLGATQVESPTMHNEFTAIIEQDEEWFIAYCPEIPGANGQGRSADEARSNLGEAIALILEDRRQIGVHPVPHGREEQGFAMFGAEHEMDIKFGQRLTHNESLGRPFRAFGRKLVRFP